MSSRPIPSSKALHLFTLGAFALPAAGLAACDPDDTPEGRDTPAPDAGSDTDTSTTPPQLSEELREELSGFCEKYLRCYEDYFYEAYLSVRDCESYLEDYYLDLQNIGDEACADALLAYFDCVETNACGDYDACTQLVSTAYDVCW